MAADKQISAGNEERRTQDVAAPAPARPEKKARTSPFEFLQQVRTETAKVTWPTRRETMITTIMVFAFTAAAAIFFLITDQVIRLVLSFVLQALR